MAELRQLRAFVAVAEELNFTRAAERLFLGQQAVSKSVRQLERELGVTLLERTSRDVRLTAAGASLLREGRDALAAVDAAFKHAHEIGSGTAGTLTIGVSPAVGSSERDELLSVLRHRGEISVVLREIRSEQIAPLLRGRELDLAVTRTAPQTPEVASAAIASTPARLYVAADHRLASHRPPVEVTELDGERLLTWNPPGTPYTDLLIERLAASGARVEAVEARVSGMSASLTDLADRRAVAIGPPGMPKDGRVVELDLAAGIELPLLVLWRAGVPTAAVDRIREGMMTARATTVATRGHRGAIP